MPIKNRRPKGRVDAAQPKLTVDVWLALTDQVDAPDATLDAFLLTDPDRSNELRALWERYGEIVLKHWITAKPGSRPS
jgi:hypothetical protein